MVRNWGTSKGSIILYHLSGFFTTWAFSVGFETSTPFLLLAFIEVGIGTYLYIHTKQVKCKSSVPSFSAPITNYTSDKRQDSDNSKNNYNCMLAQWQRYFNKICLFVKPKKNRQKCSYISDDKPCIVVHSTPPKEKP